MTEETATLVATLREALRDREDVHLAVLFGSRARGRARRRRRNSVSQRSQIVSLSRTTPSQSKRMARMEGRGMMGVEDRSKG
ncbi:MAG TPA: hypothetical protein VGX68_25575 [Thermoanaerobaculia bacterium]|jgi:hypothetical protein|nr:hypothetical protein [Thermoanaerobaculia bacterium]